MPVNIPGSGFSTAGQGTPGAQTFNSINKAPQWLQEGVANNIQQMNDVLSTSTPQAAPGSAYDNFLKSMQAAGGTLAPVITPPTFTDQASAQAWVDANPTPGSGWRVSPSGGLQQIRGFTFPTPQSNVPNYTPEQAASQQQQFQANAIGQALQNYQGPGTYSGSSGSSQNQFTPLGSSPTQTQPASDPFTSWMSQQGLFPYNQASVISGWNPSTGYNPSASGYNPSAMPNYSMDPYP